MYYGTLAISKIFEDGIQVEAVPLFKVTLIANVSSFHIAPLARSTNNYA